MTVPFRVQSKPTRPPMPAGPRILIVEDDFLSAMAIEAALCDAGYRVVGIAADGATALALAETRGAPDLVLMDVGLRGDRDGVAVAAELRQRFGVPSLLVSGNLDPQTRALATVRAAPLGFVEKPFAEVELLLAVRAALRPIPGAAGNASNDPRTGPTPLPDAELIR